MPWWRKLCHSEPMATPNSQRLWAQLRDRHGYDVDSTVPESTLLAAHPNLRGLSATELAERLGIDVVLAERAIAGYVADCVPPELLCDAPGASVDERLARAGRPGEAGWMPRARRRDDDAGAVVVPGGQAQILPLGYGDLLYLRGEHDSNNALLTIDPPTPLDLQTLTILRSAIPSDPNDPSLPAPDAIRAFAIAMGAYGDTGNGAFIKDTGYDLGPNAWWQGKYDLNMVVPGVGTWPAPQPGESFPIDAIRKAKSAVDWYGPLPADVETEPGKLYWSDWDSDDQITHERFVFWYAQDDDGNWNRCLQVQGWSEVKGTWVLPRKWSSSVRVWMWRPSNASNPHNEGEWTTFFNFNNWLKDNQTTVFQVSVWVASIAATVLSLGTASPAAISAAATFSAALAAASSLYSNLIKGDIRGAIQSTLKFGAAMNQAAGGDIAKAFAKENPELAKFATKIAAPFEGVYNAAGAALGNIESMWNQAQAQKSKFGAIGGGFWADTLSAFAGSGAAKWMQVARLPTSGDVARELYEASPAWVKDAVALSMTLSAAEQAQASSQMGSLGSQIAIAPKVQMGGMIQISLANAQAIRATWPVPEKATDPPIPIFNATSAPPGSSSSAAPVAIVAAAGVAWVLGLFK